MKSIYLFIALFCLTACSPAKPSNEHPIVADYSAAYNAQDLQAMSALMHPDIEWLSVSGNKITVEAKGKDILTEAMKGYFSDPNMPTGVLRNWSINGDYIAVTETAHWTSKAGETKSQSALTVYQLENDLIRRVYYYPAVKP